MQRLSALDYLGVERKPGRTPFDIVLYEMYGGFLPTPRSRWCTRMLKIKPFEAYVGDGRAFSYIGIRADENREGYTAKKPPVLSQQPNIIPIYPFKDDGLGLVEIKRLLEESGLGLPHYYTWRSRSGCYFCFYQQTGEWQRLKQQHPSLFEQAQRYEKVEEEGRTFTWKEGKTLAEIARLPDQHPLPMVDDVEGCMICHL